MAARPELERLDLGDPCWARWVADRPEATPFHHPAWATVLCHAYGFRGFAAVLPGAGGRPEGGAPFLDVRGLSGRRRRVSLPFTDELPLLGTGDAARRALAAALAAEPGGSPLEVRGPVAALGWSAATVAVTHELDLTPGPDALLRRFRRSNTRRNITRAEREGVRIRAGRGAEELAAFHALHVRTRRRQGVPVQPRRFFAELHRWVLAPGLGTVLLADAPDGTTVAGALFLRWSGTTIYKFGASDPAGWPLRPNHLLFWTAIQDACRRGYERFDFGRTDAGNAGLRAFKGNWGATERALAYSGATPGRASGEEGLAGRVLGTAIRRGPAWVGRGVGATLYRFAA
jgi:CelD/BcsL family acetyltransferase involved in cellulose biosynthesis